MEWDTLDLRLRMLELAIEGGVEAISFMLLVGRPLAIIESIRKK